MAGDFSITSREDAVLDFDGWLGRQAPDVQANIGNHLKTAGAGAEQQKQFLGAAATIAADTGNDIQQVGDNWDTAWRGYAQQRWGPHMEAALDEGAFYRALKDDVSKRKEVRVQTRGFADAGVASALKMKEDDPFDVMIKAYEDSEKIAGSSKEDQAHYRETFFKAHQSAAEQVDPWRGAARNIAGLLATSVGGDGAAEREKALDWMMMLPPEAREHVVRLIASDAGTDQLGGGVRGTADRAAESMIRGFATQMRGAGSDWERARILNLQEKLNTVDDGSLMASGGDIRLLPGETPQKAYARMIGLGGKKGEPAGGSPMATTFYGRPATPAERGKLKELAQTGLERNIAAGQLAGLIDETVDPIKSKSYGEKILMNVTGSLGMMAPMMVPYAGWAIAQGGYADQEFQRQVGMGTPPETAHQLSQVTGAVQSAVERASFLFAYAPGTSGVLAKLAKKVTLPISAERLALNPWLGVVKAANRGVLIQGAEYAEEIIQDATPTLTAWMAETAGMTLPEQAQWEKELQTWKLWNPETFLTVGAGGDDGAGDSGGDGDGDFRDAGGGEAGGIPHGIRKPGPGNPGGGAGA
jgi:hypothetical protein